MAKQNKKHWLVLLVFAVLIFGYFIVSNRNDEVDAPKQMFSIDKSGAGVVADFTDSSNKIHKAVEDALASKDFSISIGEETKREVARQKVEGSIRWHARKLLVTLPEGKTAEDVKQILQEGLHKTGGEVLTPEAQPDEYQGSSVVRFDIGIRDKLDGDEVTLITDRVYITTQKTEKPVVNKVQGKGKLAIIIDDFGYSADPIEAFAAIPEPLTFSVLPHKAHSNEAASRALSSGHQVMLHLPMEALSGAEKPEPSTITVKMSDQEIEQTVNSAIQSVPGLIGVNNHQGSKATADSRVMKDVLTVIRANGLFFVDSRTNSQSVAYDLSRDLGLSSGHNYMFIDNSSDVDAIKEQLQIAAKAAIRIGSVTVIGHARPNTAVALKQMIPQLEAEGITLVFESELVR